MEVDEAAPVATVLLSKLNDKKPKIPPTCLEVLREGVAAFGARAFPIKELLAALGPVLDGSNGSAREVAMLLLVDLCRWIGKPPLHSLLEKLRSAQTSDFDRLFAEKEGEGKPTPSLWLRKDRPAPGSEPVAGGGAKAGASADDDGREFVNEVDLAKKLKSSDFAKLVAEEKWSEQQNGLQIVIDALGPAPKIKAGCDVHDVLAACKNFLRTGHVQVQVSTLKVITLLADGLRQEFGKDVRPLLQSIILKCKEKRLVPEVQASLSMIVKYCCMFDSMVEDIKEQISNKKVPTYGRAALLEFTTQTLVEQPERVSVDCLKPLVEACAGCCEDSDPKVRECSVFALAALQKVVKAKGKGASEANRLLLALENSCPRVYKKMQEGNTAPPGGVASSTTSLPSSAGAGDAVVKPATAAPKKAGPAVTDKADGDAKKRTSSSSSSSSAAPPKKTAVSSSSAGAAAAKKVSSGAAAASSASQEDEAVEEVALTLEDAVAALAVLEVPGWDGPAQTLMDSEKWQERVEALESIGKAIVDRKIGGQISAPLVAYLSHKTKTFKISNVNILKAVIQTTCNAAQAVGESKFSKAAAWTLLKEFGDKLSDKKTKEPVETLLTALGEATSASFVIRRMKVVMDKVKAPIAHQFYLEWLKGAIKDFGSTSFPVSFACQFLTAEMDNKDGKVRTAAVEVFGALYNQLGPRMQAMAFNDETKPQLKALIEAEFTKVGFDPTAAANSTRKGESGEGTVEGTIPRLDIMTLVDKNILAELNLIEGKTSWTNRKVALEAIIAACERSGHFLDASKGLVELVRALKPRMNDTQANLKPLAASATGHLIASTELASAAKLLRIIAEPLLGGLADNKKGMRDATVAALQMAVTLKGKDGENAQAEHTLLAALVAPICEALANPAGRQELLDWLFKQNESLRGDVNELTVPLVLSMQDKTASVRAVAEQLLTALSAKAVVSRLAIEKATRDLPPAVKRTLATTIDKILLAHGTGSSGAASSLPPAPVPSMSATVAPPQPPSASASKIDVQITKPSSLPPVPAATEKEKAKQAAPHAAAPSMVASASVTASEDAAAATAPGSPGRDSWLLKKTTKAKRLDEFFRLNWPQPPEDPSEVEMSALRTVWEPLMSAELAALVFPVTKGGALTNQDSMLPAMNELTNQLQGPFALQHVDLILRWSCYVLGMRESSSGLLKVLQLLVDCFTLLQKSSEGVLLHDSEVLSVLPHLIDKSGHKSERHKAQFKAAIAAASVVMPPAKVNQHLLAGLSCKNKKSRVVCCEEILRVVEGAGASSLGRAGVKEVGTFLDSKDNDALGRNACLELCYALYASLGGEQPKLMKLLGDLSERSVSLIDDRIKQKNKTAPAGGFGTKTTSSSSAVISPTPEMRRSATATTVAAPVMRSATKEVPKAAEPRASPFRLEMTPPDEIEGVMDDAAHPRGAATGVTPTVLGMDEEAEGLVPTWTKTPGPAPAPVTVRTATKALSPLSLGLPEMESALAAVSPTAPLTPGSAKRVDRAAAAIANATAEIENVYNDIGSRIDALLLDDRADLMLASDPVHEQAVSYMKILHSIVAGEWFKERVPEDDALLRAHSNALVLRMVACLTRAFEKPVLMSMDSPGSHLNLDFDLASISVSVVFAMSKRSDIVQQLPTQTIVSILRECFRRLVDDRIAGKQDDECAQQMDRALTLTIMRFVQELGPGNAIVAVLDVASSCGKDLPEICAQPVSKVLGRILTEEIRRAQPFTVPSADPCLLLQKLDEFLLPYVLSHPSTEAEELAFSCGKTLLTEMIRHLSVKTVLSIATETAGLSQTSPVVKFAAKIGGVVVESDPELQKRVMALIDDITQGGRDKPSAIRQLHQLKKAHPHLDLGQYLAGVSLAFRRYVLDQLAKIEVENNGGVRGGDEKENCVAAESVPTPQASKGLALASTAASATPTAADSSSSEAMRILEGIKSKTSALRPLAAGGENGTTATVEQPKGSSPSSLPSLQP
jgi:hypothetical protein